MIIKEYFRIGDDYCVEVEYDDDSFGIDPNWEEISKEEYLNWKRTSRDRNIPIAD